MNRPMDGLIFKLLVFWTGSKNSFLSYSQFGQVMGQNFVKNQPWLRSSIRGSHTFSIPASIKGEVPRDSFPLGACILRSSHSPIACQSCSPPPTLKNWVLQSFPKEFFILRLTKFTLLHRFHCHFLLHCRHGFSSDRCVAQVYNSFSGFHSRCFTRQKGMLHLLHAQHQPIGSVFLSRTLHS